MSEFKNLEKIHPGARRSVPAYLEEVLRILGRDEILSVFLYGSVTGKDYNPRTSDINIGIVLRDVSVQKLKKLAKLVKKGTKKKIAVPLFLTSTYIKRSLDTFPIEFIEIKDFSLIIYGEDHLSGIKIEKEDLRKECESQIKGKLITIRQAYLEQALNRRGLERLIKTVFSSLMPVFRNMLRLKSSEEPPVSREDILSAISEVFGINAEPFMEILRDKKADGKISGRDPEVFLEEFAHELAKLSDIIDGSAGIL